MTGKTASGIIVYLQEELGDARLRAQQLTQLIQKATELVEHSDAKDKVYEQAGHLLYGIPNTAFKLQKALDAAALAAARLDYEEIKQGLKPEKVEELEAALDDARLRYLNRRSTEEAMNKKTASDILTQIADETEATGAVPVAKLARLIASLEHGAKRASDQPARAAATFRAAAQHLLTAPNVSRLKLAQGLRRVLADSQMDPTAGAGEEFQKENPKITDEQAKKIDEEHEKNKDVVKDNAKEARFETGKPADPTQNMDPADAETWKAMNDKYRDVVKDQHKSASGWQFTPDPRGGFGAGTAKAVVGPVEVVVKGPEQGKYTATFRMEHTIEHKDRERTVTQGALALSRCADEISRLASAIPYK